MKQLTVIMILICNLFCYNLRAQNCDSIKKTEIRLNVVKIDSIVIRTLDWSVLAFGYLGYNRKVFDETYDYILNNPNERQDTPIWYIKIDDDLSLSLLIAMLNNLQPYIYQEPTHDEIIAKSEDFSIDNYVMVGYARNDDPIEVRGQIKIYFKDQSVKIGYMSPTLLDYNNARYLSAPLTSFIYNYCGYLDKGNVK